MTIKELPVFYFGHLFNVLNDHAVPLDKWLAEHRLDKAKLMQPGANISTAQFDALIHTVLMKTELQHLGLLVGQRLQIAHHGAFGLGILNCSSIRQIVDFVQAYLITRIPFIEISAYEENDEIVILANDVHWQGAMHRFVIEVVSLAMLNLFLALKQRHPDININRLFFDFDKPQYHSKYQMFAPAQIEFNHGFCGLAFDMKWADFVLKDVDPMSFEQAKIMCDLEKRKLSEHMSVAGRVRQCVVSKEGELPTLQSVASELHMSARTLHRELSREGTSFKELLEQYQAKKAREYLLAYGYSVSKTAMLLGYSDTANFRRAFKRWYQLTPSEYLDKHAAGGM
ncbi:helix-turn-helix domain-containing protein [Glaciecola siphonariae]|uniref:Helix-turn-helix domain-containing protein n=1 Tax=Glaciecola siphonariae TaxID=521012 RepID=A0ABV9LVP5_9ALTE